MHRPDDARSVKSLRNLMPAASKHARTHAQECVRHIVIKTVRYKFHDVEFRKANMHKKIFE